MGFVYFIRNDMNQTKIGYTNRIVTERLKELNSPGLEIIYQYETKYPTQLEKALHFRFKHNKIEREWFDLSNINIDDLKKICYHLDDAVNAKNNFKL